MPRKRRSASESLHESIHDFFRRLDPPAGTVVVAVSGGADSTALLHALLTLPGRHFALEAAHVNHHLRGRESDDDEQTVRALCGSLYVPLTVLDGTLDDRRVRARGVEAAAREARYKLLRALRHGDPGRVIATAHQANDQAETLLLRLVTGRGPWRLAGIRPVHDGVIRPLIHISRETVEAYLREQGLDARRDSSNESPRFLRNRIRRELLPILCAMNPRVVAHLGETAELEQEREALLTSVVATWSDAFDRTPSSSSVRLDRLPPDPLIRRLLIRSEIRRLDPDERYLDVPALGRLGELTAAPGRARPSRTVELASDGELLTVRRITPRASATDYELSLSPGSAVAADAAGWIIAAGIERPADAPASAYRQDLALGGASKGTIVVRNRRRGDRFRPLGMRDEKKLSDFFIDRKIARDIRDTLPLVLIDGRIAWIAGTEVSDDFRLGRGESERLVLWAWRVGDDR